MKLLLWSDVLEKIKIAHTEDFNTLDFSESVFKNTATKIKVICKINNHGEFFQIPADLYHGHGCPKCGIEKRINKRKRSKEKLIQECKDIHGDRYDYSLINNFVSSKDKMKIICHVKDKDDKEHGEFEQCPDSHIGQKAGCPKCSYLDRNRSRRITFNDYINRVKAVHSDKEYDYSNVNFIDSNNKVKLICKKKDINGIEHGEFEQLPFDTFNGHGCPTCWKSGYSAQEKEILEIAKRYYDEVESNTRSIITPKEIDIYISSIKLGIEFNGLYWHTEDRIGKDAHLNKTDKSEEKGIHLIQIFGDEWTYKRGIVESRLLNVFHKTPNKIYARKCDIREVAIKEGKPFLEVNHLQGYSSYEIGLGLYFEDKLVSLMTFGKRRVCLGKKTSEEGDIELIRFASILNCNVIGSAERLFKNYVRTYNPKKITSYADRFWTMKDSNNVYEKLGFKYDGVTAPNYFYVINGVRKHRYGFRKGILVKEGYDPKMSERQIMEMRGIKRIFNSGNLRYIWKA